MNISQWFTPKKVVALVACVAIFALVFVVIPFSFGAIVTAEAERLGEKALKAHLYIGKIYISTLTGNATLSDVDVGNPDGWGAGDAVRTPLVRIDMSPFALLHKKVEIASVVVSRPFINYEASKGWSNIDQLEKNAKSHPHEHRLLEDKKFVIESLLITSPTVRFHTPIPGHEVMTVTLPDIRMRNVGGNGSGGISSSEVMSIVLRQLLPSINSHLAAETAKFMTKEGEKAAEGIERGVERGVEKLLP